MGIPIAILVMKRLTSNPLRRMIERMERKAPAVEPIKFILDVHLGRLARWLRMLGFDTLYRNDYDDPEIVAIAAQEGRTILTRDLGIMKRRAVTHGYHVQSTKPREQLHEVLTRYQLHDQIKPFHRCIVCNGVLHTAPKEAVLAELEPKTLLYYDEFFQCTDCRKIYWRGSHFERMSSFINELNDQSKEGEG
jgi:uncharacterized protein with PIN domain